MARSRLYHIPPDPGDERLIDDTGDRRFLSICPAWAPLSPTDWRTTVRRINIFVFSTNLLFLYPTLHNCGVKLGLWHYLTHQDSIGNALRGWALIGTVYPRL